ncbi:MAG TPA: hypothetical protein VHM70_06750 [Polyangiaceae bacterium]|nr:hypothetical protein [Polyangiaceae bacterium]
MVTSSNIHYDSEWPHQMNTTPEAPKPYCSALCALLLSGCGAFAGATTLVPVNADKAEFGPTAGYRVSLGDSDGLMVGGFGSMTFPASPSHHTGHGLMGGGLSYGNLPLPIEPHLGFEGGVGLTGGWSSSTGKATPAGGWYLDIGLPYRVSPTRRPWQMTSRALTYFSVEPALQLMQLFHVSAAREVETCMTFSLRLQLDQWVVAEP